jgi:hypothetical protein
MAKMNTEQRLAFIASQKSGEPVVDLERYTSSFNAALMYYNEHHDNKEKRKWALTYIAKMDKKLAVEINKIDADWEFRSYGTLARILMRGSILQEKENAWMTTRLEQLKNLIPVGNVSNVVEENKTNVVSIQDRILEKAREIAGEIDGNIDDFVLAGCPKDFKISVTIKALNAPIAKHISSFYVKQKKELEEVLEGKDEQLVEGYSNFNKTQLKRFLALIDSIVGDAEQVKKTVVRKPRARKTKPAAEVVKRLKFKKADETYGIESIAPYKIIGSSELWVFNTKYKKLQVYRAIDNDTLTVKGTTILNYNTTTSASKTLRKPEMVKDYAKMGKRALNTAYKDIKTKPTVPNGRVNEECIIMVAF